MYFLRDFLAHFNWTFLSSINFVCRTLTLMGFVGFWTRSSTVRRRWIWPSIYSCRSLSQMSHRPSCMARRSIKWRPLAARPPVHPSRPIRRVSPQLPTVALPIHIRTHIHPYPFPFPWTWQMAHAMRASTRFASPRLDTLSLALSLCLSL